MARLPGWWDKLVHPSGARIDEVRAQTYNAMDNICIKEEREVFNMHGEHERSTHGQPTNVARPTTLVGVWMKADMKFSDVCDGDEGMGKLAR